MDRLFFSISVPVYNAEKYLDKCIESVMNQSVQDFELILVDDGSKDNSASICQKWCDKYPDKIKLIKKENSGSLYTRRVCLEKSSGDYLYIIDADDYFVHNDVLKLIKETIENSNCDLLLFNATSDEVDNKKYFDYEYENKMVFEKDNLKKIYEDILIKDNLNALWNKVFKRELVDWDSEYVNLDHVTNGTDFYQMLPIISNAKKIVYLDEILYFYRLEANGESIVHKFKETVFPALRSNFLRLCEYVNLWQLNDDRIQSILKARYMKVASTSAYKLILVKKNEKVDSIKYLKAIGEDEQFRKFYSLKSLPLSRKIIVFMLYHKLYGILDFCFKMIRNIKK